MFFSQGESKSGDSLKDKVAQLQLLNADCTALSVSVLEAIDVFKKSVEEGKESEKVNNLFNDGIDTKCMANLSNISATLENLGDEELALGFVEGLPEATKELKGYLTSLKDVDTDKARQVHYQVAIKFMDKINDICSGNAQTVEPQQSSKKM